MRAAAMLVTDARAIATLQTALDRAQQRIRDVETANATMAGRLAAAKQLADQAEKQLALALKLLEP